MASGRATRGRIGVGDLAPPFELRSQAGELIRLDDLLSRGAVVLFFYPKDDSPGCTAQACGFRDRYEAFAAVGAQVVGISSDSAESHERFALKHRLPFTLLSDPGGEVRKRYGVPSTLGVLPGRVTYVIDGDGIVRHVFSSQLGTARHVTEALAALDSLERPAPLTVRPPTDGSE